ncbi:MAG: DNA-binding transcriptional LysR family regulator [Gammaproteobacteria bacterium]|jgi:DNA-binding transcriptional LysR family regulator
MINHLRAIYIFNKAVETGSFRATARALDLSPSVVSYHISRLEKEYSMALFYRSTRRLTLTQDGKRIFDKVQPLIQGVESELDTLSTNIEQPVGELKITAPAGFSGGFITRQIASFSNQYPNIKLSISYSDLHEDIIGNGIDLAIRGGAMKDSNLMSRKIFSLERKLVASPEFISKLQTLKTPKDLLTLNWIWHESTPNYRTFKHTKSGRSQKVKINPTMVVDNGSAMCGMAMEGLGLITAPTYLMNEYLNAGKLLELLPNWKLDPFEIHAVWPGNSPRIGITSRFIDYLAGANID